MGCWWKAWIEVFGRDISGIEKSLDQRLRSGND